MEKTVNQFVLRGELETRAFGTRLARLLHAGDIVLLRGPLGAGKTSLARGLICALCGDIDVPSPTYTLVQTYDAPEFEIWHFDLYRLASERDIWELGIEDALGSGVCLIEWPERIESLLPDSALTIQIEIQSEQRSVSVSGNADWEPRLERL